MRRRALTGFTVLGIVAACRAPTQIVVAIRTNVSCSAAATWRGVAVYTGRPGLDVETRAPTLATLACDENGQVGEVVLVPSGDKSDEIGIRVVAGIDKNPEECRAAGYAGCIVARRAIRFSPNESLDVVVDLTSECVGVGCDETRTCAAGSCVNASAPTPPPPADAGDKGPNLICGDGGSSCPANDPERVCCMSFEQGKATGTCTSTQKCPSTSAALHCDDSSQCPFVAGQQTVCCGTFSGTLRGGFCTAPGRCQFQGGLREILCQKRTECPGGGFCQASTTPGYYVCIGGF